MKDKNLETALECFFSENKNDMKSNLEIEKYIKLRIRPVMEFLILNEDIEKISKLEKMSFFGEKEIDFFIKYANENRRIEPLLWLMHLKNEKYGFRDREFML